MTLLFHHGLNVLGLHPWSPGKLGASALVRALKVDKDLLVPWWALTWENSHWVYPLVVKHGWEIPLKMGIDYWENHRTNLGSHG